MLPVLPLSQEHELLRLPACHIRYRTICGVALDFWVLPRAVFTMGFEKIETERLEGDIKFLAHLFESVVCVEPKADTLETVVAHSKGDVRFRHACPAE